MSTSKVTVLMTVYNGEKYLQEAIDSILNQTYKNFEFIIIDDASLDSTQNILNAQKDSRIRLVKNEQNIGFTKSLNLGIAIARGHYIARMDADDISSSIRLETQIQFFNNHPEFAVIGSSAYLIDDNKKNIGIVRKKINIAFNNLLADNQFIHGSTMINREVLEEMGGYNEFFLIAEDYDLWLRIAKKYKVGNVPEILYHLRIHNDSMTKRENKELPLYPIFAIKLNCNTLDEKKVDFIKSEGIGNLIKYLNRKELAFYYDSLADMYLRNGEYKKGREQYIKIFYLFPYNLINIFRFIRSFFGIRVIVNTHIIYLFCLNKIFIFRNILFGRTYHKMKNNSFEPDE